jgi:hypothetical protein
MDMLNCRFLAAAGKRLPICEVALAAALVVGADADFFIRRSCNPVSRFRFHIFSVGTGLKLATTFCTPPATLAFADSSARAGISHLILTTRSAMLFKVEDLMFPYPWPLGQEPTTS